MLIRPSKLRCRTGGLTFYLLIKSAKDFFSALKLLFKHGSL